MHDRPPLNKSEQEIQNLLSPTTSIDRDDLLYRCGYEAALAEIKQASTLQNQSRHNSFCKTQHGFRLLSLVASATAILLACLLWQQTQLTRQQSVQLESQETQLAKLTTDAAPLSTNDEAQIDRTAPPKITQPKNRLPNWLGDNVVQQRPNLLDRFENWPSHQPLTIAMNSSNTVSFRPRTSNQAYSPAPPKTRQQLIDELSKNLVN